MRQDRSTLRRCTILAVFVWILAPAMVFAEWTNPVNLGPNVNTSSNENGPFVFGQKLFFSSNQPGGQGGYDIRSSLWLGNGWGSSQGVDQLNSTANDRAPSLACVDGHPEVVFGSDRAGDYGVWWSSNAGACPDTPPELWGTPGDLPVNSSDSESMPSLSPDGSKLYFGSNRPDGFGGYDIWVSDRLGGGLWSDPVNLGPEVNSSANEGGPSLSADGMTLYFSSNRTGTEGGIDLWQSVNVGRGWTTPENLGAEINTEYDETCPQESESGEELYFRSTDPTGYGQGAFGFGDLYVAIPEPATLSLLALTGLLVTRRR